jgi:hypothetical protein
MTTAAKKATARKSTEPKHNPTPSVEPVDQPVFARRRCERCTSPLHWMPGPHNPKSA